MKTRLSLFFVVPFVEAFMSKYNPERDRVMCCVHVLAIRVGSMATGKWLAVEWIPRIGVRGFQ